MDSIPLSRVRSSILRRQGLIKPFDVPLDALRAMIAVQTQYAASLPTSVATRVRSVQPDWDEDALAAGGSLIKSWSLRHTLHAHTVADHGLVVGTLGAHLYPNYLRFMRNRRSIDAVHELESRVLEALADGPLTRRELHEKVPELRSIEGVGWGLDVMGLAFQRRLCIVGRGADQRFCMLPHRAVEPCYGELLRRYLASYGPASRADFAFWTGLKAPQVQAAFSELGEEAVPVHVEGLNGKLFMLVGSIDEGAEDQLGVRLLAKFDPLILAHKDKSIFIASEHKKQVFRIAGQVEAVVLVEGLAAGTWRMERKSSKIVYTVEPFRSLGKREAARLDKEAARMAKAFGADNYSIQFATG
ncbi:MAG: winged helix DNA-binding domain-containing protein [Fimbriimonas sp.]|nr:winged helix DNA-binding domain-containing protein [Fimbriimonas sp.]